MRGCHRLNVVYGGRTLGLVERDRGDILGGRVRCQRLGVYQEVRVFLVERSRRNGFWGLRFGGLWIGIVRVLFRELSARTQGEGSNHPKFELRGGVSWRKSTTFNINYCYAYGAFLDVALDVALDSMLNGAFDDGVLDRAFLDGAFIDDAFLVAFHVAFHIALNDL